MLVEENGNMKAIFDDGSEILIEPNGNVLSVMKKLLKVVEKLDSQTPWRMVNEKLVDLTSKVDELQCKVTVMEQAIDVRTFEDLKKWCT